MVNNEVHENLLQFLIEQKVNFLPRQINRDKKLEKQQWFLNGPDYNCFSFWTGFDGDRKVPNIALFFSLNTPFQLRLVLNSRSDVSALPLLNDIAEQLSLKPVANRKNEWTKTLGESLIDEDELYTAINSFLKNEKLIVDDLVEKHSHNRVKLVSDDKFLKVIQNLNKYRDLKNKLDFSSTDTIGIRKKLKRKGVKNKSENKEIRTILSKRLEVKQTHNILQNKLFKSLSKEHSQSYLIMEENFIDLKYEDDKTITLYEVKPYVSVNRCIKESLGQLMGYYFNLHNPKNKSVKLTIVGPSRITGTDEKYLEFIKSHFKTEIDYLFLSKD